MKVVWVILQQPCHSKENGLCLHKMSHFNLILTCYMKFILGLFS